MSLLLFSRWETKRKLLKDWLDFVPRPRTASFAPCFPSMFRFLRTCEWRGQRRAWKEWLSGLRNWEEKERERKEEISVRFGLRSLSIEMKDRPTRRISSRYLFLRRNEFFSPSFSPVSKVTQLFMLLLGDELASERAWEEEDVISLHNNFTRCSSFLLRLFALFPRFPRPFCHGLFVLLIRFPPFRHTSPVPFTPSFGIFSLQVR